MYQYRCKIVTWIDGDTLDVDIDLGFYTTLRKRVRVDGINCPEIHSRDPFEKAAGYVARNAALTFAPLYATVTIQTARASREQEKFGRWLAKITLPDGQDFAEKMLAAGHARPYHGEAR